MRSENARPPAPIWPKVPIGGSEPSMHFHFSLAKTAQPYPHDASCESPHVVAVRCVDNAPAGFLAPQPHDPSEAPSEAGETPSALFDVPVRLARLLEARLRLRAAGAGG
jgi:hypothetical protein